ncbi:MAG: Ig-like domain repeat protein, partial [Elusimicrobia bacterium]|nr:Ig-like domain repeat protein [Candidatus Obscuribacterium magneticum]
MGFYRCHRKLFKAASLLGLVGLTFFFGTPVGYGDYDWGFVEPIATTIPSNSNAAATNMTKTVNVGVGSGSQAYAVAVRFKALTDLTFNSIRFCTSDAASNNATDYRVYLASSAGNSPLFDLQQGGLGLDVSSAIAYGDLNNASLNSAAMWNTITFSSGTARVVKDNVYWIIISSNPEQAGAEQGYIAAPVGYAGYQPPLQWPNWDGDDSALDSSVKCFYTADGGDSWTGSDLIPAIMFEDSDAHVFGNMYERYTNTTANQTTKVGQVFKITQSLNIARVNIYAYTAAAPSHVPIAAIYDIDNNVNVATATFVKNDFTGSYQVIYATFPVDTSISPNTNGYRLYFWVPYATSGNIRVQAPYAQYTNRNIAASYQDSFGQYQTTAGDPTFNTGWADVSNTYPYDVAAWFTIDTTPPLVAITTPTVPGANGQFLKNVTNIEGTASDTMFLNYTNGVYLKIKDYEQGTLKMDMSGWEQGDPEYWISTPVATSGQWTFYTSAWLKSDMKGHTIRVIAKARDGSQKYSNVFSTLTFVYDLYKDAPGERPDSIPNSKGTYANNTNISGTANDKVGAIAGSGSLGYVEYAVAEVGAGKWFYGSDFNNASEKWNLGITIDPGEDGEGRHTWSKTSAFAGAEEGKEYALYTRAYDQTKTPTLSFDRNMEVIYSTVTFIWDVTPPTTSILGALTEAGNRTFGDVLPPPVNSGLSVGATFYGDFGDATSGISGSNIRVFIMDVTDKKFWSGLRTGSEASDWIACSPDFEAICADPGSASTPDSYLVATTLHTSSWSIVGPTFGTTEDSDYFWIVSRAKDSAGNLQTNFTAGVASSSFRCDMSPPVVQLTIPNVSNEFRNEIPAISGTASDASGLAQIHIEISSPSVAPSIVWNGSAWVAYSAEFSTYATIAGASPWGYTLPSGVNLADGIKYKVRVQGKDSLGRVGNSESAGQKEKNFRYDITPPTSTVTSHVDGGTYTDFQYTSGTVIDISPGLADSLDLYIKKDNGSYEGAGQYYDGYKFVGLDEATWLNAGELDVNDWPYTVNCSTNFTNNSKYWIRTRGKDSATNEEGQPIPGDPGVGGAAIRITIDRQKPDSQATSIPSAYISSLTTLTGGASDNTAIESVYLRLWGGGQTYCWGPAGSCPGGTVGFKGGDNDSFPSDPSASLYWKKVDYSAQAGTWSVTIPTLSNGIQYKVVSRARDIAKELNEGGALSNWEVDVDTVTFTYDYYSAGPPEAPGSTITFPAGGAFYSSTYSYFTGNAFDNTRLYSVETLLKVFQWGGATSYLTLSGNWDPAEPGQWPTAEPNPPNTDLTDSEPADENWRSTAPANAKWVSDAMYNLQVRSVDQAGNEEQLLSSVTFYYDPTEPNTKINFPVDDGYISKEGNIAGTASDTGFGQVNLVQVRLQRDSDDKFLDMSEGPVGTWVVDETSDTWNDVSPTGTGPWDWTLSTAAWDTGVTYEANARAYDKAGHFDHSYSTVTFSADFQGPTSIINLPTHDSTKSTLPTISGTTADNGPSGPWRVFIAYHRESNHKWWNKSNGLFELNSDGSDLPQETPSTSSNYWVLATTVPESPVRWYATGVSTPTWPASGDYHILVAAQDMASNIEDLRDTAASNTSRIMFHWTPPIPESRIQKPDGSNPYYKPSLATLSGTANSPAATGVKARLKDITNATSHQVWDGTMWVASDTIEGLVNADFINSPEWTFTIPQSSWTSLHKFQIESQALGTPNESPYQSPVPFYIDGGNPNAGITVPDVDFKVALPSLSGTATDDSDGMPSASKTVTFRLKRTDPSVQYWVSISSSWQASAVDCLTATDNSCLLGSPAGGNFYTVTHSSFQSAQAFDTGKTYTAYIVVKDRATNGVTESKDFTWDTAPPTSGITRPTANQPINGLTTPSGTADDNYAVRATSFSLQSLLYANKCYSPGTMFFTEPCPYWVGTSSDASANWSRTDAVINSLLNEYNTWYVLLSRAIDVAGNHETTFSAGVSSRTFLVDTVKPTASITFPSHGGKYKGSHVSGGPRPFTGSSSDPGSPWNSSVRRIFVRVSYLDAGDTWYWTPGPNVFSSGTAVSNSGWIQTANNTWEYFGSITWRGVDSQYTAETRSEDATYQADGTETGNFSVPASLGSDIVNFVIDNTVPTVTISQPSDGGFIQGFSQASGTVNAALSGLKQLELNISTGTAQLYYWTGSSWTTTASWFNASPDGTTGWRYTIPNGMVADSTYTLISRALDNATNYSTIYATVTFTLDLTTPTVSISTPATGKVYSPIMLSTPMGGVALDSGTCATQLSTVTVSIHDVTDGDDFNGATFTGGGPYPLGMNDGTLTDWRFNDSDLTLENEHQYTVTARAKDKAGNYKDSTVNTFFFDSDIPTTTVTSPLPPYVTGFTTISGTASDERFGDRNYNAKLGTYTVGIAFYEVQSNKWWAGSLFDGVNPTYYEVKNDTTTEINNWTYTVPTGLKSKFIDGYSYRIVPRGVDLAGNAEFAASTAPAGVGFTVTYDSSPATLTITTPNDSTPADDTQPRLSTVTMITGVTNDAGGTGVQAVQVRIYKSDPARYWAYGDDYSPSAYTIDVANDGTAWFNAAGSNTWTNWYTTFTFLTDYKYHIEARALDKAGIYSVVFATASFIFDKNVPQSAVTTPTDTSIIKSLTEITGTMAETGTRYKGTVNPVKIAIRELGPPSGGLWWDDLNKDFLLGGPPTTDNASLGVGVSTWSFSGLTTNDLYSGTSYYATVRAYDNAVTPNDEGFYSVRSVTFTFDSAAPTVNIILPANGSFITNTVPFTSSGTATDATSGVQTIQVSIKNGSNYWSGTHNGSGNFIGSPNYVTADFAANPTWIFTIPTTELTQDFVHGQNYEVQARAWDVAGTTSGWTAVQTVTYDIGTPTGVVTVPISYMSQGQSQIQGTAIDTPAGVAKVEVALSSDSAGGDGTWYNGTGFTVSLSSNTVWQATSTWANLGGGQISWAWDRPTLQHGKTYSILLRVTDKAGNEKTWSLSERKTFLYDSGSPNATFSDPNQDFERVLSIVSGGSTDNDSPITLVEVAISTGVAAPYTDQYWDGSKWVTGDPIWFNAEAIDGNYNTTSEGWKFSASTPTWLNNRIYKVHAKPKDSAGNNANIAVATFTFDDTPATAGIVEPEHLEAFQRLTLVTGTMADGFNPKPQIVKVALRQPDGTFWNTSEWDDYDSVASWMDATAVYTDTWTFTGLPSSWDDKTIYRLYVKAIDLAGNPVADPDFPNAGRQFRIDYSSPTSAVDSLSTSATNYLNYHPATVSGWANDAQGGSSIKTVKIRVRRSDGLYLNAAENDWNLQASSFPIATSNGTSWGKTFNDPENTFVNGYRYDVESQATDNSTPGNIQQVYTAATFVVDKSTPSSGFGNIGSGYFNKSLTTLTGTISDVLVPPGNIPSGVNRVNVKIFDGQDDAAANPWWNGQAWDNVNQATQAVVYSTTWTLSAIPTDWSHGTNQDGRWYAFYVQAIDRSTNTETFNVFVSTYDIQPGTTTILKPNTGVVSALTRISGTATDTTFGYKSLLSVQFAIQRDNGVDTKWYRYIDPANGTWEPSGDKIWNTADSYNPATGDWYKDTVQENLWDNMVTYRLYTRAVDKAGNAQTSEVYPSTYTFVFQPPPSSVVLQKPTSNRFYNQNLTEVTGTANADTVEVRVQVERNSDPTDRYWSCVSKSWVSQSTWCVANALAVPNWTWNSSVPAVGDWFSHASSFTVRARGYNSAQISTSIVSAAFSYDTQEPFSLALSPLAGFTSHFIRIEGTASDQVGQAGLNNVKVDIQRTNKPDKSNADNYYWNGSTWTDTRPYLGSQLTSIGSNLWRWTFDIAYSTMFENGYKYKIYSFSEDDSYTTNNVFDGNNEPEDSYSTVYDISMPTAAITSVAGGSMRSSVSVASGSITDALGANQDGNAPGYGQVDDIRLALRRNSNGSYWGGQDWKAGPDPTFSTVTIHPSSWSYVSMPDLSLAIYNRESFTLITKAKDKALNENALYVVGTASVTFTVDNKAPSTAINIPATNAIRSQLLAITGAVDDNTSSDYPNNSGVNGVSNVDVLVYYVQDQTTYYWNGTIFTSGITEGQAWKTADSFVAQGPSSGTWSYNALDMLKMDPPTVMNGWITDRSYVVKARSRDKAFPTPNLGAQAVSYNVIIDTTPPTSGVTLPNSSPIKSLTKISGTSNADLAGFGNIKFSIRDHNNNYFDHSGFNTSAEVFLDTRTLTGSTGNQIYSSTFVTSSHLTSGSTYTVRIYGTDAAQPNANSQVGGTPGLFAFQFDNVVPETLSLTAPVNNGAYGPSKLLNNITGQAGDNHSGLSKVELEIFDYTDGVYWGGSDFNQGSSSWVFVNQPYEDWSVASPVWRVNKTYQMRARAIDVAANISTTSTAEYVYDSTAPVVSTITVPSQLYQSSGTINVLSGTAQDGLANPRSGLKKIEVALYDADGGGDDWYSGNRTNGFNKASAEWRMTSSTITVGNSSAPWSYPYGTDEIPDWEKGHQYELHVKATDNADNVSSVLVSTFVYDPTIPTGFISVPKDDAGVDYESALSTIAGTAGDTTGGVRAGCTSYVQIRIRHIPGNKWWDLNDPGGPNWDTDSSLTDETAWFMAFTTNNWTNWYFSGSTPTWVSGISYAISMRVFDAAGNMSALYYSTFTYDTNRPNSFVTAPAPGTVVRTLGTGVAGTAEDTGSYVTSMRIAARNLSDMKWWNAINDDFTDNSPTPLFSSPFSLSTPSWSYPNSSMGNDDLLSGASYYVTSEATDKAGNVENDFDSGSSTFTFDNTSPITYVTRPAAGGVLYGSEPYYSLFSSMTGLADDFLMLPANCNLNAGIGSSGVKVSIKDNDTGQYWKQGSSNFSETDESASFFSATFVGQSSGTWAYAPAGFNAALTHGHTYVVRSSATDIVSNVQVNISSEVFVFDSSGPVTAISVPATGVSRKTLVEITGTARDYPITLKRVGMAKVDLQIIDLGNDHALGGAGSNADRYWDGASTFSVTSSSLTISISGQGQVTWSYDNPDNMWEYGHTYYIRATAYDTLSNITPQMASSQFVFDSSAPETMITRPAEGIGYNGTTNPLLNISGTARDMPLSPLVNVGVVPSTYKLTVRKDNDKDNVPDSGDKYWDGAYPGAFDQTDEVIINMNADGGVDYSTGAPTWNSGYRYFIESWAEDALGNAEPRHVRQFTVDNVPPDSTVTTPNEGDSFKDLDVISGTAKDDTSSIDQVAVIVRDLGLNLVVGGGDDKYWSEIQNQWINTSTQVVANLVDVYPASATWNLTTAGNKLPTEWTSGRIYWIIPQAFDSAENVEVEFSTRTFKVDSIAPIAGIITPANDSGFNSLTYLTGTAEGTEVGNKDFSSIAYVKLQIIDISTSPIKYWNGALFTTNLSSITATFVGQSSGTWSYDESALDSQYQSGHRYLVVSWAADTAFNTQTTFSVGTSSNTFSFDNVHATSTISVPVDKQAYRTFTTLNGLAGDDFSGVAKVDLTINYILAGDTYYWDGTLFSSPTYKTVTSSVVVQYQNSVSWSYGTGSLLPKLTPTREYNVFSRAYDKGNNYETNCATHTFLFDTDFGTAAISNPTGTGVFKSPAVPLTQIEGTAVDYPNHAYAGIARNEMRIRRDPPGTEYWNGLTWVVDSSTWLVVSGSTTWTYPEPSTQWNDNTEYFINIQAIDLAGNLSPFPTQAFTFDSSTPAVVLQNPNAGFEKSLTAVSGTAGDFVTDRKSGLSNVKVAIRRNPLGVGKWWDGNGFNVEDMNHSNFGELGWTPASTTTDGGHWELPTSSQPSWVNDTTYLVQVRSQDVALNFSTPIVTRTFTYDDQNPSVGIWLPAGEPTKPRYTSLPMIQGISTDTTNSNLDRVELRIYRHDLTKYYNPASSRENPTFNLDDGTTEWFIATTTEAFTTWYA